MRCPEFEGALLFYINQECLGILATSVPDKIFAFVELHGDCEKVSLTPVHSIAQVHRIIVHSTYLSTRGWLFITMHAWLVSCTHIDLHSQENLPLEIKEVRDKEADMRRHKKTIQEKEEVIQVLEKRIDELNAQITTMQASRGKSSSKNIPPTPPQQPQANGPADTQVSQVTVTTASLALL